MTLDEDLLEAMVKASEQGLVSWETTEANYLWTSSEGWTLGVHHVERGDGESFRDIIEIGAAGVSMHYYRGTVGYQIASRLLNLTDPHFVKHNDLIEQRINSELTRIREDLLRD